MRSPRLITTLVLATVPVGCDSAGTCKPGTVQVGGTCYAHDPNDDVPPVVTVDPPVRTRAVGTVHLTSDEHATIYYTTDGSTPTKLSLNENDLVTLPNVPDDATVSFFAVDVNGNASAVQSVRWQIDRNGPGAPTPFDVALAGEMRTVTWTPPSDPNLAGVLVARVDGLLNASPEPGRRYFPGDVIAPGISVVAAVATGFAGSFSESRTSTPGLVRYVAWSYDDIYNYGPAAGDYAMTTIGAQTGSISVAAGTGVVTPTAQPSHMMFAGSAVLNGSNLTVKLDITNATSRTLFSPKLLLTNTLTTQTFDNSDGTFDSLPYRALGGAILPGSKVTTTLEIGNVTNTDVVTLAFDVRDGTLFVAGHWSDTIGSAIDEATESIVVDLQGGTTWGRGSVEAHGGGVTPDGRLVTGSRNSADLGSYDLSTGQRVLSTRLATGKYYIRKLTLDASGSAGYALLGAGHAYGSRFVGHPTELVTFDAATLKETGRLDIGSSRNRDIALSPDGRWVAIATATEGNGVVLVDLGPLRIARTFPTELDATGVIFSADSKSLIATGSFGVSVYDVGDGSLEQSIGIPGGGTSFDSAFGGDGRLWIGRRDDLAAVDLTTGATEVFSIQSAVLEAFGGKIYVCEEGDSNVQRIDTSGNSETTLDFSDSVYGHWVGHSPF